MREEEKVVAQVVILSVEAVDFRGNFKRCSLVYFGELWKFGLYRSKKEVEKFLQIFARYISARNTNIVIIFVMIIDNPPAKGISCLKINGVFVQWDIVFVIYRWENHPVCVPLCGE